MKLNAKVIAVKSSNRVTLKFPEATGIVDVLDFDNPDNFALDDEIEVTVEQRQRVTMPEDSVLAAVLEASGASRDVAVDVSEHIMEAAERHA